MLKLIPAIIGAAILAALVHATLGSAMAHFKDALPCQLEQHADGDCDHHDDGDATQEEDR